MRHKHLWIVFGGILLITILIIMAFNQQNAYLLFIASVMPLLIVPFLPDIRTNQWVSSTDKNRSVQIFKLSSRPDTPVKFVVIQFNPGTINWRKHLLCFSILDLPTVTQANFNPSAAATLSVLKHDLVAYKKHSVGIDLKYLASRSTGFSYTLDEVERLLIPIQEIQELYDQFSSKVNKTTTSVPAATSASNANNKSLKI